MTTDTPHFAHIYCIHCFKICVHFQQVHISVNTFTYTFKRLTKIESNTNANEEENAMKNLCSSKYPKYLISMPLQKTFARA